MIKSFLIRVSGDVQGVSFRYLAKKEAKRLGLAGWAKNEHDGSVSVFIQGDPEKAQEFVTWAKDGSPMATVEEVRVEVADMDEAIKDFEVK